MSKNYPMVSERIQSTFIDSILIAIGIFAIASLFEGYENAPNWLRAAAFIAILLYEPIAVAFGCTVGNYIKRVRVKDDDFPTNRIGIFRSILRYFIKLSLGWISFITINTDPKKRAIHDYAAGSVMIKI